MKVTLMVVLCETAVAPSTGDVAVTARAARVVKPVGCVKTEGSATPAASCAAVLTRIL